MVKAFGFSRADLKKIAKTMVVKNKTNRLVLLFTALVLALLNDRYEASVGVWKNVVEKSSDWFKKEIAETGAEVEGLLLEEWADERAQKWFFIR